MQSTQQKRAIISSYPVNQRDEAGEEVRNQAAGFPLEWLASRRTEGAGHTELQMHVGHPRLQELTPRAKLIEPMASCRNPSLTQHEAPSHN